ncbi:MAG: hypothetical protein UIM24_05440 [Clostridia bacterium]|nr:hypothetical protein [Clostridia bacterium]
MKYQAVTVFKRNGDDWDTVVFQKAYVRRVKAVDTENGGRYEKDILTARIFSPSAVSICTEDKIAEGSGYSSLPENALTVSDIVDNYCLKRGHIRITAR